MQFFTDGRLYQIHVKKIAINSDMKQESLPSNEQMEIEPNEHDFVFINSERVPGKSLLHKLDIIYTMFS